MCLYLLQGYCTVRSNNFNSPKAKDDKRRKREKKKRNKDPELNLEWSPKTFWPFFLVSSVYVCVCIYVVIYQAIGFFQTNLNFFVF